MVAGYRLNGSNSECIVVALNKKNKQTKTMEQTIELMRKRHAYYIKLIEQNDIHTALEFYAKLYELFAMFGVDVYLNEAETECTIAITCEDYDYEDYTVVDGKDGGLAAISPVVGWKHPTYMCCDEIDIFADEQLH